MRKLAIILCLNLMMLPVIWNGIGLLHYVMEHTHTFCEADLAEHTHQIPDDCISICQLTVSQSNQQLPTTNDYYELKICLVQIPFFKRLLHNPSNKENFIESYLLESHFSDDIFNPPIS